MKYENVDRAVVIKLTIEQHEYVIKNLQKDDIALTVTYQNTPGSLSVSQSWHTVFSLNNCETNSPYRKPFLNFIQDAVDFHKDEINKLLEEIKTL